MCLYPKEIPQTLWPLTPEQEFGLPPVACGVLAYDKTMIENTETVNTLTNHAG
jgi:hypothetical protein